VPRYKTAANAGVMILEVAMNLEHGISTISLCDNVISVKIDGSFNLEGIISYHKKLTSIIESLQLIKFKMLIDFLDAEGATPDALEENNKFNIWLEDKNLVAKAVVIDSAALLNVFISRVPAQKSQNIQSFDNKASGYKWLKLQS